MIIKEELTGKYKHVKTDLGFILYVEVKSYEIKEDESDSIPVYFYKKAKTKDVNELKRLERLK